MPTIDSSLRSSAARVPERLALVFADRTYTYRELDAQVDRVAGVLSDRGVRKGDRLALLARNSDRFVITFYAAQRLGAIFVPVNPASAAPEIDYIVRDSGASLLVMDPGFERLVDGVLPESVSRLALGPADRLDELLALAADWHGDSVDVEVGEFDDCEILYTSGTTGNPKGALFDHHRVIWIAMSTIGNCEFAEGERILHVAPLYHSAELNLFIVAGTLLGATHVVHPGFDPAAVLDTLEQERITAFFGVPTMYQFLLRQPGLADRDLSAWRVATFGAAPMPPTAIEQLITTLPSVRFVQLCGQTEAGPGGIFSSHEQVRARPDANGRQGGLYTECRIVDPDGNDTAPGEAGHPAIRDVAVLGRPHADYGESIVAVVTLAPDTSLELGELREFLGSRIATYKLPHDLMVVEEIPRNPSGKILKRELRKQLVD
jgi:acyl-CoA synthetase (AMP-forming)/AMP-acid ligase II